jgi:uncharacterized membrane protein
MSDAESAHEGDTGADATSASRPDGEDARGVGRLVGFTDAVVAIAITLIVLPLVDSAQSSPSESASGFLADNAFGLLAAALSFVVIASFWRDHHRLYKEVRGGTAALVNTNLLWLAGIIFLPLPTVLIVNSPGHDPVAAALYIGTVLVTAIAIRLQELIIVRADLLRPGTVPPPLFLWADWIVVGLLLIAFIVTVAIPATGLYPLFVVLLGRPISWLVLRGTSAAARDRRIL